MRAPRKRFKADGPSGGAVSAPSPGDHLIAYGCGLDIHHAAYCAGMTPLLVAIALGLGYLASGGCLGAVPAAHAGDDPTRRIVAGSFAVIARDERG